MSHLRLQNLYFINVFIQFLIYALTMFLLMFYESYKQKQKQNLPRHYKQKCNASKTQLIERNFVLNRILQHFFQVVCHKCSGQKFPLRFEESKSSRVCRACFQLLHLHAEKDALKSGEENPEKSGMDPTADEADPAIIGGRDSIDAPVRPKGLLEVFNRV